MSNLLTKAQTRRFRKLVRKAIVQGHYHEENIIEFYHIIHEEAQRQFNEDNRATLDHFLNMCWLKAKARVL